MTAVKDMPKEDARRVARAALAGYELRRLADGRWLIGRWNLQRELRDDDEVDAFLERVAAHG